MKRQDKWVVYGENGDTFTNIKEAKECAKQASIIDGSASVTLLADDCSYIDYKNGRIVRDGWTVKKVKESKEQKFVPTPSTFFF